MASNEACGLSKEELLKLPHTSQPRCLMMIDLCPVCNEKGVQLRVAGHRSSKMRPTENVSSSTPAPTPEIKEVKPLEIEVIVDLGGDSSKRFFSSSVAQPGVEYAEYIPPKSTPAIQSKKKTIVTTTALSSNSHATVASEYRGSVEESSVEIISQPTKKIKITQREKPSTGGSLPDLTQLPEVERSANVWQQQQDESSSGIVKKNRVVCPHGRQKSRCRDCGGVAFCTHGRIRYDCRDCSMEGDIKVKTSRFCEHGRSRYLCLSCKGTGLCVHEIERRICKECKGSNYCPHGKRSSLQCRECRMNASVQDYTADDDDTA